MKVIEGSLRINVMFHNTVKGQVYQTGAGYVCMRAGNEHMVNLRTGDLWSPQTQDHFYHLPDAELYVKGAPKCSPS